MGELKLPDMIREMFGSNPPDDDIIAALTEKISYIYEQLEKSSSSQHSDGLIKMVLEKEKLQSAPLGGPFAKAFILLATDWTALPPDAIFNYLAGNFTSHSKQIGSVINSLSARANDLHLIAEHKIVHLVSGENIGHLTTALKVDIPEKRKAEEALIASNVDAAFPAQGKLTDQTLGLSSAIWRLPAGMVLSEEDQRARLEPDARALVIERRKRAWTGGDAAFQESLEADQEAIEVEVQKVIETQLITYINRDEVRKYLFQWKWHFDEKVADRMNRLLEVVVSPGTSETLLSPDVLLIRLIRDELGTSYPEKVDPPPDGLKQLIAAYVAMDELGKSLEAGRIILDREAYDRSMAIGKSEDMTGTMGALVVQDPGDALVKGGIPLEKLVGARLANESERMALHYLRTGKPVAGAVNDTQYISFEEVATSIKQLAVARFKYDYYRVPHEAAFMAVLASEYPDTRPTVQRLYKAHPRIDEDFLHDLTENCPQIDESFLGATRAKYLEQEGMQHLRGAFLQAETAFKETTLPRLQRQLDDFQSEKYYLVDKHLGFHGITGRVAHVANDFLSEEKKVTLQDIPGQDTNPAMKIFITAAALVHLTAGFADRIFKKRAPNPAKVLDELTSPLNGHATRILIERAGVDHSREGAVPPR